VPIGAKCLHFLTRPRAVWYGAQALSFPSATHTFRFRHTVHGSALARYAATFAFSWNSLRRRCCCKPTGNRNKSRDPVDLLGEAQCSRKRVQQLKKNNKKSCFFRILKKTYVCSFKSTWSPRSLMHNYRKSVPVSHQQQTFCTEMRTQETTRLTISPRNNQEFLGQNFYRHTFSQLGMFTVITERKKCVNSFRGSDD